jgi:hypothetical protein
MLAHTSRGRTSRRTCVVCLPVPVRAPLCGGWKRLSQFAEQIPISESMPLRSETVTQVLQCNFHTGDMMETSPRLASFIYITPSPAEGACGYPSQERQILAENKNRAVPRFATSKSNKRRQEQTQLDVVVENELMQLCRSKDWVNVVRRCRSNPEEATPKQIPENQNGNRFFSHSVKRCVKRSFFDFDESETLYYETPLGLACASSDLNTDILHEAVSALILARPSQIRASQLIPGHTPLRDVILNPCCSVGVLMGLLNAEEILCDEPHVPMSALAKKDRNGHLPMDHLVMGVQLGKTLRSMELFQKYFGHTIQSKLSAGIEYSPLIRLFTIGSSLGSRTSKSSGDEETSQPRRILEATKYVLQRDPSAMSKRSKLTDCSPLHAALRNFGNYLPLINVLTSRPESNEIMAHRNRFGDLPLHVACSVGVPFEILSRIVDCTIAAAKPSNLGSPFSAHPLLWSVNNSGYTPVDLEWVRHIEGGQGFDSTRSFYPLEPSGVRRHCFKQDEYYHDLLREAVDHVILQDKSFADGKNLNTKRQGEANNTFGSLLDRISLLVTAASSAVPATASPTLLHNVCRLSSVRGPDLPGPLIELFLWLHRDQILLKDEHGMLPLHYSISRHRPEKAADESKPNILDWKRHLLKLLKMEPEASKETTKAGRLPLHIILDHIDEHDDDLSLQEIVQELIRCFPESVDRPDPITGLDPFLLAARHLDVAYFLLRRSPSRCVRGDK